MPTFFVVFGSDQPRSLWSRTAPRAQSCFCSTRTTIGWRISIHRQFGARSSFWLLDAMRPSAYGIYLLHFIFLIWLQYIVYDPAFPVFVKFAIVFTGTLSMSWTLTVLLRRIPIVARTI